MINALIKIVESNDFKTKWSSYEKMEFKNFFLKWIGVYWREIFGTSAIQNKLMILLNKLFEGLSINKKVQDGYQKCDSSIYNEYIQLFLNDQEFINIANW